MAVKSVIFLFSISVLPCSIRALYAVIGLPPSSAGFVQLTPIDVASIFTVKVGEPGASEGKQEGGMQVGSLYACANQGPVSVTFRTGTHILKLNAKEIRTIAPSYILSC